MSHQDRPQTLFFDAVAIPTWLETDDQLPFAERVARDRDIVRRCNHTTPLRRVRSWWRHVTRTGEATRSACSTAARTVRLRRLGGLCVTTVGLFVGCSTSLAVFHYDGSTPVNVVTVLALLVAVQLGLLGGSLLLMLPRVPGLALLQDLLESINPGHYAAQGLRRLAGADEHTGWSPPPGPVTRQWLRWQILTWSQLAAVAFNLGALAVAAALIVFTDLAFGWGTTLDIDAAGMQRVTVALAWPWHALWPAAVPDPMLIENSRIFRLQGAVDAALPARALTGWWPFLVCAVSVYGLLPRVALLLLALARLRAGTRRLLLDDPRVRALLDRMHEPSVEFTTSAREHPPEVRPSMSRQAPGVAARAIAIVWADALADDAAAERFVTSTRHHVEQVLRAGGSTIDEDETTLTAVSARSADAILIVVRGWEAPLLDLVDFLGALRRRCAPGQAIIVVPIGVDGTAPAPSQRATWARWVARLDDPDIRLDVVD
ncbi:MAG: DUF2868 domain-containing protein [Gammaproteobacteria bacterium]